TEPCDSPKCPASVDNSYPQGWVVHDYWEYQPSAQKVRNDRSAKAERQRRWLERKQARERDASKDASQDESKDNAPSPSPPRPEGSGAGNAPRSAANGRASPPGSPARAAKPPWCGQCDESTRQTGDPPGRCPACHPLATGPEAGAWRASHPREDHHA